MEIIQRKREKIQYVNQKTEFSLSLHISLNFLYSLSIRFHSFPFSFFHELIFSLFPEFQGGEERKILLVMKEKKIAETCESNQVLFFSSLSLHFGGREMHYLATNVRGIELKKRE